MAQRRTHVVNQLESDATEFGVGVRCGGWRLGLLVARNVEPGKAGRPPADNRSPVNDSAKVSMNKFAELASVPVSKVKYYYDAWELAAKASLVPSAATITPGDEEICIDADAIEVEDDPRTQWSWFYSMAVNPPKPKETSKDSKPKDSKEPEPTIQTDSSESDDESVDDDFGIGSFTKEQVREADSSIQRNKLLEVLESVRAAISRVEQAGKAQGENDAILGQISSAALDLMSTANAMVTASVKEDAPNV